MVLSGRKKLIQLFKITAVSLGVYILFKYMLPIVMPFVLAYALCRLLYPAVLFLNRKWRFPVGLGGTVLVAAVSVASLFILYLSGQYLFGQAKLFIQNTETWSHELMRIFGGLCEGIGRFIGCGGELVREKLLIWGGHMTADFQENLYDILKSHGFPVIRGIFTIGVVLTVAAVGAALLIKNKSEIDSHIKQSEFFFEISEIMARMCQVTGCFFKAQAVIIAIVAVICSVGLKLAGTGYAVVIGTGIAVLDALPVIGSGTILVPWLVIDLFIGKYSHAAALGIIYALCAVVREVLEARLMGNSLGVNEFYMMAATFIGLNLFGIGGIILGPLGLILILELLRQLKKRYRL